MSTSYFTLILRFHEPDNFSARSLQRLTRQWALCRTPNRHANSRHEDGASPVSAQLIRAWARGMSVQERRCVLHDLAVKAFLEFNAIRNAIAYSVTQPSKYSAAASTSALDFRTVFI